MAINYRYGNIIENIQRHPEYRGWIMGNFIQHDDWFKTDNIEVKCAVHPKGDIKKAAVSEKPAGTFVMLLDGEFTYDLHGQSKSFVMNRLGDYVIYDAAKAEHVNKALEDSSLLVVRWFDNASSIKTIPYYKSGSILEIATHQFEILGINSNLDASLKSNSVGLQYIESETFSSPADHGKLLLVLLEGRIISSKYNVELTKLGDYISLLAEDLESLELTKPSKYLVLSWD